MGLVWLLFCASAAIVAASLALTCARLVQAQTEVQEQEQAPPADGAAERPPDPAPEPALEPPAPAPAPRFPRYADVTPLVRAAAARRGASAAVMLRIVWCESKNGTHAATYRADTIHRGPYQFNRATWQEQAPRHGIPAGWDDALDPEYNVDLAAALIAAGQTWRWPNC